MVSLIALGVIIAGVIVNLATFFGVFLEKYFGWQVFLGLLTISGLIWWHLQKNKKRENIKEEI